MFSTEGHLKCLHERFEAHSSAVNLTADEARKKLKMCLQNRCSVTSSDLDICWRELTDTVVTISKIKGQKSSSTGR